MPPFRIVASKATSTPVAICIAAIIILAWANIATRQTLTWFTLACALLIVAILYFRPSVWRVMDSTGKTTGQYRTHAEAKAVADRLAIDAEVTPPTTP